MNKERVYVGADMLGPGGDYQQTEVALYFTPQASAASPVQNSTQRTLCTSDGAPFILPSGAVIARIVAMPAPYDSRAAHAENASSAALAALETAKITLTRHPVESTDPLKFGMAEDIRVHSPEDAVTGNASNTTGWITTACELPLGPKRLATGQALAVFGGGQDGKGAAKNPVGTPDTGFTSGPFYAHKSTAADSASFINQPTLVRGRFTGTVPLEYDVSVVLTYRLRLKTFTVLEYEPFPPELS
jgi:hypothetical protein